MASRNGRLPPVTLAEIRPGQGAVGLLLNLSLQVGLSTALELNPQQLSLESINKHLVMHHSSLRVLLSSVYPAPIDAALTPEFSDLLIQALGAEDALLLLDLGHEINDVNRKLLNKVDRIVLIVEPERLSLLRGNQMVIELKRMGVSPRAIGGVLVNRLAAHNPISYQKTQDTLGAALLAVIPPAPELALEAIETTTPMVMLQPTSLLAEQFKTLARMLIDNRT
jgi:Flp pilus assembly CpaE family ATPase